MAVTTGEQAQKAPLVQRMEAGFSLPKLSTERAILSGLVLLYLFFSLSFLVVVPYGEAPDEYDHVNYIQYIVLYHDLPPIRKKAYTYEAFQPPLYYALGAAFVIVGRWITFQPADSGRIAPRLDSNPGRNKEDDPTRYMSALHPADKRWPFWPLFLRGLGVLMGLGVVLLTYATARVLMPPPAPYTAPILAAGFVALLPQANFIRASVSNTNLADLIGAIMLWLMVLHLSRPYSQGRVLALGVFTGLGLLTKASFFPFVPALLWVLWVRRGGSYRRLGRDLLTTAVTVALLAGGVYLQRLMMYGEPLAIRVWAEMAPLHAQGDFRMADFFWFQEPFRMMLWTSFWGVFGWQVIFMPAWVYNSLAFATALAFAGGVYAAVGRALNWAQKMSCVLITGLLLLLYALVIVVTTRQVVWQGRELYPVLSGTGVLFGIGLAALVDGRGINRPMLGSKRRLLLSAALLVVVLGGLTALNVYSLGWLVYPAFN